MIARPADNHDRFSWMFGKPASNPENINANGVQFLGEVGIVTVDVEAMPSDHSVLPESTVSPKQAKH
jgi:hypothetical protein